MKDRTLDGVRRHADALYRAGMECCHQHDRFARLLGQAAVEVEESAADQLCKTCDETLGQLAREYERAVAGVASDASAPWLQQANALWMATREYSRRHAGCDSLSRKLARHTPEDLTKLHAEFELEASALLALRQACDAYRRARPDAAA